MGNFSETSDSGKLAAANMSSLAERMPNSFIMALTPFSDGFNGSEKSVFRLVIDEKKSLDVVRFQKRDLYSESNSSYISYNKSYFIDFFNRLGYIEKHFNGDEKLIWLMCWVEFFFWNYEKEGFFGADVNFNYSRDPIDYIWLANSDYSRKNKIKILAAGLYLEKDIEPYKGIPDFYLEAVAEIPEVESILSKYSAPIITL